MFFFLKKIIGKNQTSLKKKWKKNTKPFATRKRRLQLNRVDKQKEQPTITSKHTLVVSDEKNP